MNLTKIFTSVCTLIITIACDIREPDYEYCVANVSNDTVYYLHEHSDNYLPSVLPSYTILHKLAPGEINKWPIWWNWNWNEYSLVLMFYKSHTIREYSWAEIQEKDTIDCVRFYTLEDLKRINFMIEYEGECNE